MHTPEVRKPKGNRMAGERLRIPLAPDYEAALGRFLFVFARLQWAAAWCIDSFGDMRISQIVRDRQTATPIAQKLVAVAIRLPKGPCQQELVKLSNEFLLLATKFRNDVMHATPATVEEKQILVGGGRIWALRDIEQAADRIASVEIGLSALFHDPPDGWRVGAPRP